MSDEPKQTYTLQLFVTGGDLASTQANENIERLCQTQLQDNYRLEVIDVSTNLIAALENNVVFTPMLLLVDPPPRVTILGDLNDTTKVLSALRLSRED